jgi:hypothetical protein
MEILVGIVLPAILIFIWFKVLVKFKMKDWVWMTTFALIIVFAIMFWFSPVLINQNFNMIEEEITGYTELIQDNHWYGTTVKLKYENGYTEILVNDVVVSDDKVGLYKVTQDYESCENKFPNVILPSLSNSEAYILYLKKGK